MRLLRNISSFFAAAVLAAACSGASDESSLPVLKADVAEIDIAEGGTVSFTVTYQGSDVTADSEIFIDGRESGLPGASFAPETAGTYSFTAVYDGKRSNSVTVNVTDSSPVVESKYERHVNIIEFTGAWCVNCPDGYQKMMLTLSKPSMKKYDGRIHICAFHSNEEGEDTMALPQTQDVFKLFKGLAYPSFVTDLRNVEGHYGVLTDEGSADLQPSIEASFNEYPAHCGVAVSSVLNDARTEAAVTVKVASELTSEYRAVVLVVEDKVVGPQMTTTYPTGQGDPNYIHKHVVRAVVTTYAATFTGEKLTEDGSIKAGEEVTKKWSVPLASSWNLANTEIHALILDKDGSVNNMNLCLIENGNSGYNLKK